MLSIKILKVLWTICGPVVTGLILWLTRAWCPFLCEGHLLTVGSPGAGQTSVHLQRHPGASNSDSLAGSPCACPSLPPLYIQNHVWEKMDRGSFTATQGWGRRDAAGESLHPQTAEDSFVWPKTVFRWRYSWRKLQVCQISLQDHISLAWKTSSLGWDTSSSPSTSYGDFGIYLKQHWEPNPLTPIKSRFTIDNLKLLTQIFKTLAVWRKNQLALSIDSVNH